MSREFFMALPLIVMATLGAIALTGPFWWDPLRSLFAPKPIRDLARRIRATSPADWVGDDATVYSEKLDITLWIANEGYALRAWLGKRESGWDRGYLFKGGAMGAAIWRAWAQKITARNFTY